jgi:hypothetical protein
MKISIGKNEPLIKEEVQEKLDNTITEKMLEISEYGKRNNSVAISVRDL